MEIDSAIFEKLKEKYDELEREDKVFPFKQLETYYETFQQKFGPERLLNVEGEELLELMHNSANRESLCYWLEFKNDQEFKTPWFGSIAGGSAFKFGLFKRRDEEWISGSPQKQVTLTVREAVEKAKQHRQQLVDGCRLLEEMPENANDVDYLELQEKIEEIAPDICDASWARKYFHMMYPKKVDDFHTTRIQRFHLMKMQITPPEREGRYVCSGKFIRLANEMDLPVNVFTWLLNEHFGAHHQYWRIGTSDGDSPRNQWEAMKASSCVAIGWEELGDLSWVEYNQKSRDKLKELFGEKYPNTPQVESRKSNEVFKFVARIKIDDVVLAGDGKSILGIGRVVGDYEFDPSKDFPHVRKVEWLSFEEWDQVKPFEGLNTTVCEIKQPKNIIYTEGLTADAPPIRTTASVTSTAAGAVPVLPLISRRIEAILQRKSQVVLYGPPGTGKTYWARRTACDLASIAKHNKLFDDLSEAERKTIFDSEGNTACLVNMCCFHPAYGYEDFIEGFKPTVTAKQEMVFERKDGVFKEICNRAQLNPEGQYYLIIDEINRGDIPRIFGELMTILEKSKRAGEKESLCIVLPHSKQAFSVPSNLFIIGTMNTADRSIALLDTALRRRFGFVELMPDPSLLKGVSVEGIPLSSWLSELNNRIIREIGRDSRNLQIGHSYLLEGGHPIKDFAKFKRILQEDIIPLLQEYCYEDYEMLEKILGEGIIDVDAQVVKAEIFEPSSKEALIQALWNPEIASTKEAIDAQEETEEEESDGNDDDNESES